MKIDRKMLFKNSNQLILESFSNEQNYLDLINKKKYSSDEALEILENIDWDFKSFSTQYLTHTFHPYPARFIPQIPLTFIKLFTKEREIVLDPMCGCGTTLVEAFLNDRNSIGNDLNPLAALIAKVKTTLIKKDEFKYLNEKLIKMKKYLDLDYRNIDRTINGLPNRKVSKIFNKTIISKLEIIRETLIEIKEEGYYDLFDLGRIALSSTIWSLVENGNGINVDELFVKKIKSMQQILSQMSKVIKDPPDVKVICGDARNLSIENNSIDLIITSPPYVNALDYYRVHMYNMLWLGMDFDLFRKHEIGGHSHFINNRFRLLSEYLGDMLRSMIEMNRVLKRDKFCVIVVGNSSLEYELIESHKFFTEMAKKIGFIPIKTIFRNIDKTRKYTSADIGKIDEEYIVVMQKKEETHIFANDDNFVSQIVKELMLHFKEQIKNNPGTSTRGKKPSNERLLKNIDKISEAIEKIPEDIRIKE
ncbi:DNA methyltransferase [Thermodesulfovibrio yellowstonii]|uniref:DNA methyltransferase n=1 Tax=Thermodesulfovibrio yellowstonii TaxID=28262 RepID=UPI003C7B3437